MSKLNWVLINHGYSTLEIIQITGTPYTFPSVNLFLGFSSKAILGMLVTDEGLCTGRKGWSFTEVMMVFLGNSILNPMKCSQYSPHWEWAVFISSPFPSRTIKSKFFPKLLLHAMPAPEFAKYQCPRQIKSESSPISFSPYIIPPAKALHQNFYNACLNYFNGKPRLRHLHRAFLFSKAIIGR